MLILYSPKRIRKFSSSKFFIFMPSKLVSQRFWPSKHIGKFILNYKSYIWNFISIFLSDFWENLATFGQNFGTIDYSFDHLQNSPIACKDKGLYWNLELAIGDLKLELRLLRKDSRFKWVVSSLFNSHLFRLLWLGMTKFEFILILWIRWLMLKSLIIGLSRIW